MRPVLILGPELCAGEMTKHGSHSNFAPAPWRTKVELETVVFDVLIPSIALDREISAWAWLRVAMEVLTV